MFRFFSRNLTYYSNHYLDWSRTGELLLSDNHHYTAREIIVRGSIISFTAMAACLGAYLNDEELTGCRDATLALAAGFAGFVVSHLVAISPLIYKRYQVSQDCLDIVDEINQLLTEQFHDDEKYVGTVQHLVENILKKTMGDDVHDRASQTWGERKRLLETIRDNLMAECSLRHSKLKYA